MFFNKHGCCVSLMNSCATCSNLAACELFASHAYTQQPPAQLYNWPHLQGAAAPGLWVS